MHKIKHAKAKEILPFMKEMLSQDKGAVITVTGNSMFPFLRDGEDRVELAAIKSQSIGRGDIILVQEPDGRFILHRIVRKKGNEIFMAGDAYSQLEGPYSNDMVIAVVESVWRGQKQISCRTLGWRALSSLWLFLFPFRRIIIRAYGLFSNIKNKVLRTKE